MPGYEVFGDEERRAINDLFDLNGGVLFAHGFDGMRKGIFRVREFERAFAMRMQAPYAQAVASGSAAIKVALQAIGVRPGDEVITQSFTFVATIEAILEVGATPVIVDVDESLTMCPASLRRAISGKSRAVIPVHMMGAPADMAPIMDIAREHSLLVMEDTAQGLGGTYRGKALGTFGDAGAYSLDAGKTIMTGEGGMIVASNEGAFRRARAAHDHGHEYRTDVGRGNDPAVSMGFNYRMCELQGVIGLVQLGKLDYILSQQRKNKLLLRRALEGMRVQYRKIHDASGELGDTLVFFLETSAQASRFAKAMAAEGLGTKNLPDAVRWHFARHWEHIWRQVPRYAASWRSEWAKSADLLERAIALPVMVNMTEDRIGEIGVILKRIEREVM